jgi:hypothetical protein
VIPAWATDLVLIGALFLVIDGLVLAVLKPHWAVIAFASVSIVLGAVLAILAA